MVHNRSDHIGRGLGLQGHHPAVRLQRARIGHVGRQRFSIRADDIARHRVRDHELDQAVAAHVERGRPAGGERNRAQLRLDHAFIAGRRAEQGHIAPRPGRDHALIDHRGVGERRVLSKPIMPGKKVLIAHVQRTGGQRADIHARAGAKENAAGINQHDLPVGGQRAEDRARLRSQHPVQRNRGGARLLEADRLIGRDIEARPVDDQAIGRLIDPHRRTGRCADGGRPRRDVPALGERECGGRDEGKKDPGHQAGRGQRVA